MVDIDIYALMICLCIHFVDFVNKAIFVDFR